MKNRVVHTKDKLDFNIMGLFAFVNNMISILWKRNELDIDNNWFYDITGCSPYYDKNITYTDNVWEYYFKQPCQIDYSNINLNLNTTFETSTDYTNFNIVKSLHINEPSSYIFEEIHNTIFHTSKNKIILKPEILYLIDEIKSELGLDKQKYISVHYRGNDFPGVGHYGKQVDYTIWFNHIDNVLKDDLKIFLATDDENVITKFKEKYGDRIIINHYVDRTTTKNPDNFLSLPKHMEYIYQSLALSTDRKQSPYECGLYAIVDSYLLSGGETIIRTCSGLSFYSIVLNPKINVINIDIK